MRVFVTGPDGYDTFTHNVAHAFREMGHEVTTVPATTFMKRSALGRAANDFAERASNLWRLRDDRRAVKIAAAVRPNLTIICTRTFDPETIREIRRVSGGPVVCWFADAPTNVRRDHVTSGEYDAVFAKDPDFAARLQNTLGLAAHHLPEACNPAWHRSVAQRAGDRIVVAGSCYGYRNALIVRLVGAGRQVDVYGAPLSPWVPAEVRRAHAGRFLDHTDKAQVFGEAMACLGSFAPGEGPNALNCRIFETLGCGGLLLTERRKAIEDYFEPDVEYLPFDDFEDCLDRLDRVQRGEIDATGIRERGARRAHGEHTYRHRLGVMLRTLELS